MQSCEAHQALLLEYLFDVLDELERTALEQHLAGCAQCSAALEKARRQQHLLAAAARGDFSDVRFTAPPAEVPAILPLPRRRLIRVRRWATAAAVLVALSVPAWLIGSTAIEYAQAKKAADEGDAAVASETTKMRQIDADLRRIPGLRQLKIVEVVNAQREREMKLVVTGPRSVQSGAPTAFQVQTLNFNDQPIEAEVWANVASNGKELGERINALPAEEGGRRIVGSYRLTLPPDLPSAANANVSLRVSARREGGARAEVGEFLVSGHAAYLTHLATDKPMYQPGETVYFRSLSLDPKTLQPAAEDLDLVYTITNPRQAQVYQRQGSTKLLGMNAATKTYSRVVGPDGKEVHGVGADAFDLPRNAEGGEYVLSVDETQGRFPRQERRFVVNAYQKHVLEKVLDFNRKSYGPGDEVQALCKATDARGAVKGAAITASLVIDGQSYGADGAVNGSFPALTTDDQGTVIIRCKLPTVIEKGQASLGVTFNNGTVTETLSRTVPIVLKKLTVEFFPEGGDLIAGLPNRVYFQVRTPLGKPADLRGRLLQDGKPTGTVLATLTDDKEPGINQGMGRFDFEPKAGSKYEVQVESPLGITDRFALPAVKTDGVLLSVPEGVIGAGQSIRVVVQSTKPRSLMIGAYCRGNSLAAVHLTNGQSEAVLRPTTGEGGVCRITVWEEVQGGGKRGVLRPVAERLVYRVPAQQLKVALTTDRASYVPGMKTKLMVETRDEHDQPAPALVMLGVVDKSVLAMADEKTARTMPTHFLLTTEVRRGEDLEYADVLLGSHPRATEALDLLLGTQGWRRFAEQDPGKFRAAQANVRDGADVERLLVALGQSAPQTRNFAHEQISEVHDQFNHRIDVLAQEYAQAGQAVETAQTNSAYLAALERLGSYRATWNTVRQTLFPAAAALFLLGTIACLILAVTRGTVRKALPFYAGVAACTIVVVTLMSNWNDNAPPGAPNAPARVALAPMANDRFAKARDMERLAEGGAGAEIPEAINGNLNEERFADEMRKGNDNARELQAAMAKADVAKEKAPEMAEKKMKRKAAGDFDLGVPQGLGAGPLLAKRAPAMARMPAADRAEKPMAKDGVMENKQAALLREAELLGGKGELRQPRQQSLVVREYAHVAPPKANPEERSDFAETLFWHPVIVLPHGKADVSFSLSDSVTRFQATAFAHTTNGRLGAASLVFESKLPFTLLPKTPLEVTAGDRIDIPVGIANNTGAARTIDLAVKQHTNLELLDGKENERLNVPGEAARRVYAVRPTAKQGQAVLTFEGKTNGFGNDTVRSEFRIVPEGFPRAGSISDMLEGGAQHTVKLPEAWIPGTLEMQVQVYASTLADLQKGLESLLREPGGCFEQTSTASYPNVLILDYLKSAKNANPDVERRARDLLDRGYQRLTSFECEVGARSGDRARARVMREGYEWFGGTAPPHEALTAYGLLQFRDMARYREVDPVMVQRTQSFLLARRDKQGGFLRNDRALDTFGRASKPITDAYIVWALTTAGCEEPLTAELDALTKQAGDSKDPYFLSLVANSLINKARTAEAVVLLKKIADAQAADGHLDGADMSITSSRGHDLQIETTALAVLGWLKANPGEFNKPVQKAVDWIGKQRGGYGGFGSTQSTILALKALIAYTKDRPRSIKAGELKLFIGDKEVGTTAFKAGVSDTITLLAAEAEKWLKQGDNKVRIELTGGNTLPYTLAWSYRTKQPASAGDCPLRLETKLAKAAATEGEAVQLRVKLRNTAKTGQGMAVVVVGLPGGMTIPEDLKQLKEYAKVPEGGSRPLIGAFEIRGRELVLYWRDLQAEQEIEVPIDLICRVPGEYTGPASRAYLYYNSDGKCWIEPLRVAIGVEK